MKPDFSATNVNFARRSSAMHRRTSTTPRTA